MDLRSSEKFMTEFKKQMKRVNGPNPFADRNRYHLLKQELTKMLPSNNCDCIKCTNGLWCPSVTTRVFPDTNIGRTRNSMVMVSFYKFLIMDIEVVELRRIRVMCATNTMKKLNSKMDKFIEGICEFQILIFRS